MDLEILRNYKGHITTHFTHVPMDTETSGNSLKVQRKPMSGSGSPSHTQDTRLGLPLQFSEGNSHWPLAWSSLLLNSIRMIMIYMKYYQ